MFFHVQKRGQKDKKNVSFNKIRQLAMTTDWKSGCNVVTNSWWKYKYWGSKYLEWFTKNMVQAFKRLASICNKRICALWSALSKYFSRKPHQIYEKTWLMKFFLSKNASLLPCNNNIKDSITGIFLSICEILWHSYSVM